MGGEREREGEREERNDRREGGKGGNQVRCMYMQEIQGSCVSLHFIINRSSIIEFEAWQESLKCMSRGR